MADISRLVGELRTTVDRVADMHAARGEDLQAGRLCKSGVELASMATALATIARGLPNDRLTAEVIGGVDEKERGVTEDEKRAVRGRVSHNNGLHFGRS